MANALGGSTSGITKITSGTPLAGASSPTNLSPTDKAVQSGAYDFNLSEGPGTNYLNLGGNGGQPIAKATTVDPYAGTVFGSTAGYNKATADFNASQNSVNNSINDAVGSGASGYNSSILDYLAGRQQQQNTINSSSVQNELAREQGQQGIMDMVGNGIKSGGVVLANSNAGSSSAGEALARAYGTIGRQQSSSVGNQFAQGQSKIAADQNNLTLADATQARHTQEDKTNTINSIVSSARTQLASLNSAAQYASLPQRVDIENKIATIKQQAMDALSQYDSVLSGGIASQGPQSAEDVRASANKLLTAGTGPTNAFDYTTDVPTNLQGTGQFASSLPIFISPSARKQQT